MFDDEAAILKVVRSGKGRYSIWPAERDCPPGWRSVGFPAPGTNVWTGFAACG